MSDYYCGECGVDKPFHGMWCKIGLAEADLKRKDYMREYDAKRRTAGRPDQPAVSPPHSTEPPADSLAGVKLGKPSPKDLG